MGFRWAALALGLAGACGPARAQQIWFDPHLPQAGSSETSDYWQLFSDPAAWPDSLAATGVFVLEPNFVHDATDAQLSEIGAFLAAHRIAADFDVQSIAKQDGESCGGIEGYSWPGEMLADVRRLRGAGVPVGYFHLDEPLGFGHLDTDPAACQLAIPELASRVAEIVEQVQGVFPNAAIVDVESLPGLTAAPGWQSVYLAFKQQVEASIGARLTALQLDVDWNDPKWRAEMLQAHALTRAHAMKFGVIYNGSPSDQSDAQWMASARQHYTEVESELRIIPQQAVFASWDAYPSRLLPERSTLTHTSLVRTYIAERTAITAAWSGQTLAGRMTWTGGYPLLRQPIFVMAPGLAPGKPLPVRSVSGVAPAQAQSAIIGVRLNIECNCAGQNSVLLGDVTFEQAAGSRVVVPAASVAQVASSSPALAAAGARLSAAGPALLRVPPGASFLFNSPVFAVSPGAPYTFDVPIGSVTGAPVFGQVTLIWIDGSGNGITRTDVVDPGDEYAIGMVMTGPGGVFQFADPTMPAYGSMVRLEFNGSGLLRPAITQVVK